MILDISHHYAISYVRPRHQKPETATAAARTRVEIREIDTFAAPVVLLVGNVNGEEQGKRFRAKSDGSQREIRMVGGKYYVESLTSDALRSAVNSDMGLNDTFMGAYKENGLLKKPRQALGYERKIDTIWSLRQSGGLREELTVDDGGKAVGDAMKAQAEKMFLIDGVSFEECREPVFAWSVRGEMGIVEAPSLVTRASKGGAGYTMTSSLVHATELLGDGNPHAETFVVVDERATTYDGLAADIVADLAQATMAIAKVSSSLPLSVLSGYLQVRDALVHVDLQNPAASAELVEAARSLADAKAERDADVALMELRKRSYYTLPSGTSHPNTRGSLKAPLPSLDKGTGMTLYSRYLSGYKDRSDAEEVMESVRRAVARWDNRPSGSTLDIGISERSVTHAGGYTVVSELPSSAAARRAGLEAGMDVADVDARIEAGQRMYAVSQGNARRIGEDIEPTIGPRPLAVAFVGGAGDFEIVALEGANLVRIDAALEEHVLETGELDRERALDQQLISIF